MATTRSSPASTAMSHLPRQVPRARGGASARGAPSLGGASSGGRAASTSGPASGGWTLGSSLASWVASATALGGVRGTLQAGEVLSFPAASSSAWSSAWVLG
jgi:hypothetical protein